MSKSKRPRLRFAVGIQAARGPRCGWFGRTRTSRRPTSRPTDHSQAKVSLHGFRWRLALRPQVVGNAGVERWRFGAGFDADPDPRVLLRYDPQAARPGWKRAFDILVPTTHLLWSEAEPPTDVTWIPAPASPALIGFHVVLIEPGAIQTLPPVPEGCQWLEPTLQLQPAGTVRVLRSSRPLDECKEHITTWEEQAAATVTPKEAARHFAPHDLDRRLALFDIGEDEVGFVVDLKVPTPGVALMVRPDLALVFPETEPGPWIADLRARLRDGRT